MFSQKVVTLQQKFGNMSKKRLIISSTTKKKLFIKGSEFCFDLAKLVFAGIIIAGIMGMEFDNYLLVAVGLVVLILLSLTGIALFIKGNQKH